MPRTETARSTYALRGHGLVFRVLLTASMKYLLLLFTCSLSFASILTVNLNVRENYAPSRHANLTVNDGTNSLFVDLYRTSAYPGEITQVGFTGCPSACVFNTLGDLTATFRIPAYGNMLVLGGVPVPLDQNGYSAWFSMNFTPGNADLNIAVTQISTGICVFCAHAPFGTFTVSSEYNSMYSYPDYRFSYHASGEIVPEPGSWQFALMGIAGLLAAGIIRRHSMSSVNS